MVPVAEAPSAIVSAFAVLSSRVEPEATLKDAPVPPIVSVLVPVACRYTKVLFEIDSDPIVCAGMLFAVTVPPLLKTRMSSTAGVVRVGVQLVEVAQDPVPATFHVYVVAAIAPEAARSVSANAPEIAAIARVHLMGPSPSSGKG